MRRGSLASVRMAVARCSPSTSEIQKVTSPVLISVMVALAFHYEFSVDRGGCERPSIAETSKVDSVIDRPGDRVSVAALLKLIDHASILNPLHIDIGRIEHIEILALISGRGTRHQDVRNRWRGRAHVDSARSWAFLDAPRLRQGRAAAR